MSRRSTLWRQLMKDYRAVFGLCIIGLATAVSILGAYIRPDSTENANAQQLILARSAPLSVYDYLEIPILPAEHNDIGSGLLFGGLDPDHRRMYYDSLKLGENGITAYFDGQEEGTVGAEQWKEVDGMDEYIADHRHRQRFILGTDGFGRDLLSRLMAGTIVSLSVGLISVLISLLIGISLGALAGYYGGRVDDLIMWLINVIWSIPTLLMVIAITLVMGKGFVQVFIAVGLTMWVEVARVVRGQVMGMKRRDFVLAGRALGYNDMRLVFRHILPNVMGPVIVISAANFASAILIEAGLSFLGIGTQIPMSSWGMMIKDHYPYITTDLAYLAILPGLCIIILVLAFMLLGNGLRDAMDVRSTT